MTSNNMCYICKIKKLKRGNSNNDWINCDICKKLFHRHCAGILEEDFKDEENSLWFCSECHIKAIKTTRTAVYNEISQHIKSSIEELVNIKFQEFRSEIFNFINKQIQSEKSKCEINVEEMSMKVKELEECYANKIQTRDYNLLLSGVPINLKMNLDTFVKSVSSIIGEEIIASDLVKCRRMKNNPSTMIITFGLIEKRNKFFEAYFKFLKKTNTKNLNHLMLSMLDTSTANDVKLYLKEHLTPYNTNLFMKCRILVRKKKIHKCYTKNGKVFVYRTAEKNEKPLFISSSEDLNQLYFNNI